MIQSATFDHNTVTKINGNNLILGVVDGLKVLVEYANDYGLEGERWTGGPCIESVKCPASDFPISLDREDELLVEALKDADENYSAAKAGYA